MLTTPPVKTLPDNCVDQYKNVNSVLDTPIFPTPTPLVTPTVNPYAPSADDANKIQITIDTLERISRAQNNISEKDSIQKLINQLRTNLTFFKIKNNG
jgi:hypothetical protein